MHGDITSLDLDGVRAVLTASDLQYDCDVSPAAHDQPLLADGVVHYLGQAVFLVVATSHLAVRKAARLTVIEYAEKAAVLTIDQAMEAGSRFEGGPVVWSAGDASGAIKNAAHSLSGSIKIGGQGHFYLEGQVALAFSQEGGDMFVHSSTQHPSEIQHKVAHSLGLPMNAVRVEARRMGGGFGGKESQVNALAVACAVVASQTGQPCKMRYDRDDDIMITGKRHDFRINYTIGYDDFGKISGIIFTHLVRCGCHRI